MRVVLKGINKAMVRLANGERITYYHAWRGGPRLVGQPGTPEFMLSYNAAIASRREPDRATFQSIIAGYRASQDFLGLSARSQLDYLKQIKKIEAAFADLPRWKTRASPANSLNGAMAWRAVRDRRIMHGRF